MRNHAQALQDDSRISDWLASLLNLPRYWLRAAAYGVRLRLMLPPSELARFILAGAGVLIGNAGVVALVAKATGLPLPEMIALGLILLLLMATILVRYLGNLSRTMGIAAWSDEAAARLRRDMATGMRNDRAYAQLIRLYKPLVDAINEDSCRCRSARRIEMVEIPRTSGEIRGYAAVMVAADHRDSLESLFDLPVDDRSHQEFSNLAETRQRLIRRWRSMESQPKKVEDERGDNYCMSMLHLGGREYGGQLRITTGVASYGEIVRSCDALINEFALFAYLTGPYSTKLRRLGGVSETHATSSLNQRVRGGLRMSPGTMLRSLPWRHRAHRLSRARPRDLRRHRRSTRHGRTPGADLLLRPRDRAAGIGIAVVTLGLEDNQERVFLGIRSSRVGTYPATHHVVPAGMCNTYGTHFVPQWRKKPPPRYYLVTAMRCEFLEEWFDEEELEKNMRTDWRDRVDKTWNEKLSPARLTVPGIPKRIESSWPLRESLVVEEIALTGIAIDLLNLRPEVCAITVVDLRDDELNWEFDELGINGPLADMGEVKRTEIVQSGAAALRLAQIARERSDVGDTGELR